MKFLLEINYCTKCGLIREVTGWLATFVKRRLRAPYCKCPPDDMLPIMAKEITEVSPFPYIAESISGKIKVKWHEDGEGGNGDGR